jgi:hypothetical protein
VLVLYGTLGLAECSILLAHEVASVSDVLGAGFRTYGSHGLPVRDIELKDHPETQDLCELVLWSAAYIGCARWPTQRKPVAIYQVNGGVQSFNTFRKSFRLVAR